jgi:hypothetical protein
MTTTCMWQWTTGTSLTSSLHCSKWQTYHRSPQRKENGSDGNLNHLNSSHELQWSSIDSPYNKNTRCQIEEQISPNVPGWKSSTHCSRGPSTEDSSWVIYLTLLSGNLVILNHCVVSYTCNLGSVQK